MTRSLNISIDLDMVTDDELPEILVNLAEGFRQRAASTDFGILHREMYVGEVTINEPMSNHEKRKALQQERDTLAVISPLSRKQRLKLLGEVLGMAPTNRETNAALAWALFYAVQDGRITLEDIKAFNEATKEIL